MRKLIVLKIAILGSMALLLLASAAWAQDEESSEHLLHELGGPFFVSRDKVQEELNLSDDQKHKLREKLFYDVREITKVYEQRKDLKDREREKAMQRLRQKSCAILEVFLEENLTANQLKRFNQLKLQYDLPATLLQPEVSRELKITDEQRQQFMGIIIDMQNEIEPLMKEAESGGNPEEIRPKVIKMRLDCQEKIEDIMSGFQKRQWKEMIGQPFVIW